MSQASFGDRLLSASGVQWREVVRALAVRELSAFAASVDGAGPFLVQLSRTVDLPPFAAATVDRRLKAILSVLEPESAVHSLAPRAGQKGVSIGRSGKHSEVVLDCQVVSKRHAEFNRPTKRWRLMDLESANGTFVEERRLPAGVERIVQSGQLLAFASCACVLLSPEHLHALVCTASEVPTVVRGGRRASAAERRPAGAVAGAKSAGSAAGPASAGAAAEAKGAGLGLSPQADPAGPAVQTKRKPGGRRMTRQLGVPSTGVTFCDFVRRTTRTPEAEFTAIYPGPFLLELPDGALDHPPPLEDGAQARIDRSRGHRLDPAILHSLTPSEGDSVLIGRVGCEVILPTTDASRKHARLQVTQTGWRLIDLESANGTEVEGRRLAVGVPTRVTSCMVVSFAFYRCLLLSAADLHSLLYTGVARGEPRDPEKVRQLQELIATPPEGVNLRDFVGVLRRFNKKQFLAHCSAQFLLQVPTDHAMPEEPTEEGAEDPDFEGTQAMSRTRIMSLQRSKKITDAKVHVIFAPQGGGALRIGRSQETCAIVLDEPSVSKEHAELIRTPDGWNLLDLESNNGSFVEGERIPAGVLVPLKGGASLNFSSYVALWLAPDMMIRLVDHLRADSKRRTS